MYREPRDEEAALLALHAMEDLLGSPAWQEIAEYWEAREREFDLKLHSVRVTDLVQMQQFQTGCRVIREILRMPEQRIAYYRGWLKASHERGE